MAYLSTITNEQTAELPSAHFDGEIIVINREEQLAAACSDLSSQRVIGFDTETRPSFKAGVTNKVALLQLSTHKRCYLIRLCRMKLHKDILRIFSNANILKIGADVSGDIRALHTLRNFTERGFVDLQQIAPEWGIEEKSLRKLSAIVLGERVSKAQRLSNWEASTLTPQQRMYAATDAWVCISIYEKLQRSPRIHKAQTPIAEQQTTKPTNSTPHERAVSEKEPKRFSQRPSPKASKPRGKRPSKYFRHKNSPKRSNPTNVSSEKTI